MNSIFDQNISKYSSLSIHTSGNKPITCVQPINTGTHHQRVQVVVSGVMVTLDFRKATHAALGSVSGITQCVF